jgi:hypothetical protein
MGMARSARFRPRFNRWELLVVALGLGWALIKAYLDPARFGNLLYHLFMIALVIAIYAVARLLVWIIVGVVKHRRRETRM